MSAEAGHEFDGFDTNLEYIFRGLAVITTVVYGSPSSALPSLDAPMN